MGWRAVVLALLLAQAGSARACLNAEQRNDLRTGAEAAARMAPEEVRQRWTAVVAAARACSQTLEELHALQARTDALEDLGAIELALASAGEQLVRAMAAGDQQVQAQTQLQLGLLQMVAGDMAAAAEALQEARRLYTLVGTPLQRARVHSELSRLQRRRGNYLEALREEQAALALRNVDPAGLEAWRSWLSLATLYEQVELFEEARQHYVKAVELAEQRGTPRDLAAALNGYAGFLNDFGGVDAALALQLAERAVALQRGFGEPVRLGTALLQVGRAQFALGRHDAAEAAYREAHALASGSAAEAPLAHVQFRWGELDLARGDVAAALGRVETARAAYQRQDNRHRLIKVHALLERIHLQRGDELAAARAGREHFRLRNELLGAGASGKLGELLTDYALSEERHRNEVLRRENAVAELSLSAERQVQAYVAGFAVLLGLVLVVLTWRHLQSRRLNRLLRQQAVEIEARRTELAQAHERLKAQSAQLYQASITDPLTGLRNRAYALNALRELLGQARTHGLRPVVMMLDLDHFKQINDQHGHLVGDRALERLAETLLGHAAPDAIVARFGGEEFLYVLRDADPASAQFQAELLRRRIQELRIEHDQGLLAISASIGVCCCAQQSDQSVQGVLRAADQALYRAKAAGRNCVLLA